MHCERSHRVIDFLKLSHEANGAVFGNLGGSSLFGEHGDKASCQTEGL